MADERRVIRLRVNGRERVAAVAPQRTLLQVLREDLGLTGTKEGCSVGECGTCTVLLDGRPVNACLVLAVTAAGQAIETIEGLGDARHSHPIQHAFAAAGAVQCGFCTPGMVLTAKALLDANPAPAEADVRRAISGNLCRCTGYEKIVQAILDAAAARGRG